MDTTNGLTRLPETEYEVMSTIWQNEPPITTSLLMEQLGKQKNWKLQTLITLLNRLIERGFLKSDKIGKERKYYPLITEEDYIHFETTYFVQHYHKNSIFNLVSAFCDQSDLSREELDELSTWLQEREKEIK